MTQPPGPYYYPPQPPPPPQRRSKGWVWVVVVLAVFIVLFVLYTIGDNSLKHRAQPPRATVSAPQSEAPATTEPDLDPVCKAALKQATNYADVMHMSEAAIFEQLTSEHGGRFEDEPARCALDNLDWDWNANALEAARTYQEVMGMSPAAIRDQLVSEHGSQFTPEQADYAIAHLNE